MKKVLFLFLVFIILVAVAWLGLISFVSTNTSSSESDTDMDMLASLPYATWVEPRKKNINKEGVTKHIESKALQGLNLYNSRNEQVAHLMDMKGQDVHSWHAKDDTGEGWHHIDIDNEGNLYAIVKDKYLSKLSPSSELMWRVKDRFHHDLSILANGDVVALARKERVISFEEKKIPILDDLIIHISSQGKVLSSYSMYDFFGKFIPKRRLKKILRKYTYSDNNKQLLARIEASDAVALKNDAIEDVFHSNTITYISQNIEGLCKQGDFLVSVRELNKIAIINLETKTTRWQWGHGILAKQHQPALLPNGNIIVFDNRPHNKASRIVELNPRTREIVWEYEADPPSSFYSAERGGVQKLANGHVLITESNRGRVFEISPSKELVWEYFNPVILEKERKDKLKRYRAAIYRMKRLPLDRNYYRGLQQP